MWSIVFSSKWQRKHLFAKENPLLWTWSKVKVFPHVASHAKKAILGSTQDLQMILLGNNRQSPGSKTKWRDLTEKFWILKTVQITLPSTSLYTLFAWSFIRKRSTLSTSQSLSQSLKGLENQGVHSPLLPSKFQAFATQASLDMAKQIRKGRKHKVAHLHITCPSKISLSDYFPLRETIYYLKDLTTFLWLSKGQHHTYLSPHKIATPLHLHHTSN